MKENAKRNKSQNLRLLDLKHKCLQIFKKYQLPTISRPSTWFIVAHHEWENSLLTRTNSKRWLTIQCVSLYYQESGNKAFSCTIIWRIITCHVRTQPELRTNSSGRYCVYWPYKCECSHYLADIHFEWLVAFYASVCKGWQKNKLYSHY